MDDPAKYSVTSESERLLHSAILDNPLVNKYIPSDAAEDAANIRFEGSARPSIPINWRFAESISVLKAYEALMVNCLLRRKYGVQGSRVTIDVDHAQLFFMSPMIAVLDPQGEPVNLLEGRRDPKAMKKLEEAFPSWDKYRAYSTLYRMSATNIYKCGDGRFYHIHSSMNPDPIFDGLEIPHEMDCQDWASAHAPYTARVKQFTSSEIQKRLVEERGQAGTPCWSAGEYLASEHGKANAHVGLFEIFHREDDAGQPPCWWPESPQTSPRRPLAGVKVVELTRVIAAPAIGKGLAELGASVMRIVAPHNPDLSTLHIDLNQGKWNAVLDLRKEDDKEKLRALVRDADVFLQGYRPGSLEKYGFGMEDVLGICKDRPRGIIYVRENCYGWQGPWKDLIGWQQISDANCGVSLGFGKAMGLDEPVTPIFPNSDFCTGVAGTTAIITALIQRGEKGGSYTIDVALNYYSQWLVNSIGTYPSAVWESLWSRYGKPVIRHDQGMGESLAPFVAMLRKEVGSTLFSPRFFRDYPIKHRNTMVRTVAPVARFQGSDDDDKNVPQPGFHVSTRTNGVDKPWWPTDLTVDVVA